MLLLSRSMLTRPSDIPPLKTVLALALIALAAGRADAARTRPASQDLQVQAAAAKEVNVGTGDVAADGVDAEQALQLDFAAARSAAVGSSATSDTDLSPLPTNQELDAASTGDVRGKLLLQAMADLPQVGTPANKSTLSLDFWDDAGSARSAVDDQASRTSEAAQANVRGIAGPHSNVMIPLPMAAWSGLSVFGGVGLVAGIRRAARRFF
jgi:hypothetical protein